MIIITIMSYFKRACYFKKEGIALVFMLISFSMRNRLCLSKILSKDHKGHLPYVVVDHGAMAASKHTKNKANGSNMSHYGYVLQRWTHFSLFSIIFLI